MDDFSENIILLVDDNSENIEFLDEALGNLYTIMAATDGYMALQIANKHIPDLILLDIVMPGMDGYEVCRKLKENEETRHIPVIFLTGKKNLDDKNLGFELGAVDYITKPFEIIEIKARVKNQLIVKRAQSYLEYQNRFLESEVHIRNRELSQTQADLEESEEKFRMLFEKSNNGIAFVQPYFNTERHLVDYEYIDVNPVYLKLLKKNHSREVLFKKESELFPGQDVDWYSIFRNTAEHGSTELFEIYHQSLDKYFTGSSYKPQQNKDYFCIILNDITEQVLYQKELIKAKEKAEESDRLKSAFLANISHEIRTPLNGIIGFTHLIKDNNHNNEENQYQDIVAGCSKKLINIIDEIIDFARIESGTFYLDYHGISLNSMIRKCAEKFRKELEIQGKESILIKEILPLPNDKDTFITDKIRFMKIFSNLMNNAVKFTTEGTIKIGYNIDEINRIEFFVSDTGIGISPEGQEFIFQSFRQEKEGYNRIHGGIGLGLAITKKMVEQMGGEISVESEKNKGSTFSFSFHSDDLNPNEVKNDKLSKNIGISDFLKDRTIILAEENPLARENIRKLLSLKKITVISANDIDQLQKDYREHPETDAIILSRKIAESLDSIPQGLNDFYGPVGKLLYLKISDSPLDYQPQKFQGIITSPLDPLDLYETLGRIIREE